MPTLLIAIDEDEDLCTVLVTLAVHLHRSVYTQAPDRTIPMFKQR